MLQHEEPSDYVIGTAQSHSVQDFVEAAAEHVSLRWQDFIEHDQEMMRPAEVDHLVADATRARADLGWTPKVTFSELVSMMVEHDLQTESEDR